MFVMAKRREREQARALRAQGLSLRQIARRLGVAPSSVSGWVRDIPLPEQPTAPPPLEPEPDTTPFRRCSRCEQILPASAFNRCGNNRQWWCRECFKAYFRARGEKHLVQVKTAKRRRRDEGTAFILHYLETHPCVACGELDPVVLEFDHLRDKRAAVSWLRANATGCPAIAEEISKCEVVCVNCHRKRTASRADWVRADRHWRDRLGGMRPEVARNLRFTYEKLEEHHCIDCGEQDICLLDFDHVGPKRKSVMQLAMHGYGYAVLKAEVTRCEIRCANCHRRRHAREAA